MNQSKLLGPIEHVIVLMFENRSFDNMLGGLRPYGPDFEGVPPGWSNPDRHGKPVPAFQAPAGQHARTLPYPDPLEDHADMMEQIDDGSMQGFVRNYAKAKGVSAENAPNIMQYYALDNIPITSALANAYAVSDQYHGSGPVQTWPNRLFAHCATPGSYRNCLSRRWKSYINNPEYPEYPLMTGQMRLPCIFKLFDKTGKFSAPAWKIYYDGEWPISTLVEYVWKRWHWVEEGGNVFALRHEKGCFFSDVKESRLPAYSFIEPRYVEQTADPLKTIPPGSNHPGSSSIFGGRPPIDICYGEHLLKEIYEALAANDELFKKTLLIVTYDEHGGCADHVPPPRATSPFRKRVQNFDYTSYGPRVPAIFINPYIKQGSVLRPGNQPGKASVFDHTSLIATLCAHFGLDGPLTPRDARAPVFAGLVDVKNGYTPAPLLPDLHCPPWKGLADSDNPPKPDEIDKNSLAYVMHCAVLEKRRRMKR